MKNKNKKWIKIRHTLIFKFFAPLVKLYCKNKYGVKITHFNKGKQNYVFIMNHQTGGDQLFLYLAINNPVYFLATEDVFSNGFSSRLLEFAFAPIPFNKTATDITAIKNCLKVAKNGGSIAICPEGNRTYSGKTEHIKPSIVKLLRALKLPVAIFKIEGGYGVQPRWADKTRKGEMTAKVVEVIEKESYDKMTDDEFFSKIKTMLFVDENNVQGEYISNKKAEYIERMVYTCPDCGFALWKSSGNTATCSKCGKKIEYNSDKSIVGVNCEFPYKNAGEWYSAQNKFVSEYKFINNEPVFIDSSSFKRVIPYKHKVLLAHSVAVKLYKDKIVVENKNTKLDITFDKVSGIAVLGKNKLNVNFDGTLYQFKGDKSFNAVKYINFYYKWKNEQGDINGELQFLGL